MDLPREEDLPKFDPPEHLTQVERNALYKDQFPNGLAFARSTVVRDRLVFGLSKEVNRFYRQTLTKATQRSVEYSVASGLRKYQEAGYLPSTFSVSSVSSEIDPHDPSRLVINMPAFVRVWMAGGDDAFTGPRFTHDCTKCAFLATHEYEEEGHRYDFYFCTAQIGHIPTVIARFSDEGRDYLSGLEIGQRQDIDMPLGLAYALARERGFTK